MKSAGTRDLVKALEYLVGDDAEEWRLIAEGEERHRIVRELVAARQASALTRAEVARRVGVSPSTLARFERGDMPGASMEFLQRLAAALGLKLLTEIHRVSKSKAA